MNRETAKHWGTSVLLHGSAVAVLLAMQIGLNRNVAKKPIEWDVSIFEPPKIEPQPEPPRPKSLSEPEPVPARAQRPLVVPRQARAPVSPPAEPVVRPSVVATPPDREFVPETQKPSSIATAQPSAPSAPAMPFADSAWLSQTLWGLMNSRKRYPLMAKRMGVEGKVLIQAVIDERGQAAQVEIQQSSGSPILDQDALALLRSILPLTSDKFRFAPRTTVVIPVAYALDR